MTGCHGLCANGVDCDAALYAAMRLQGLQQAVMLLSPGLPKLLVHMAWAARHALVHICSNMLSCAHIDRPCL